MTAGENATIVAGLTASGTPVLTAFANDTSAAGTGKGRLVVRHVAEAPAVDVYAGGSKVISGLASGQQQALDVPAGTVSAKVTLAGQTAAVLGPVNVPVTAGMGTVVYAIGSAAGHTLTAATQQYPLGGAPSSAQAGSGGLGADPDTPVWPVRRGRRGGPGADRDRRRRRGATPAGLTARRWRVRWPVAALIVGLALAGGSAVGYAVTRPPGHDYGTVPPLAVYHAGTVSHGVTVAHPAASRRSGTAGQSAAAPDVTTVRVPVRLLIPAMGHPPVLPTGVQAEPGLPARPVRRRMVGGWQLPGEPTGAVVVVGHINSAVFGPGALLRLQDVRPGDVVTVITAGQAYRYRAVALRAYVKTGLPVAAVFGQQVAPRLVIVSCGGPFDASTGHYLDNIVAYAVPSGTAP